MQVQNIYAGKKIRQTILAVKDTMPFYLHSNTKYALDNYTRFTTVEEILREYATMVNVRKKQGSFHLNLLNQVSTQMFNDDPLTLVDGVAVFDMDKFMLTDPLQLKTVDVVTRKYFLGNSIFEGIVSWTYYKGYLPDMTPGCTRPLSIMKDCRKKENFILRCIRPGEYLESSTRLPECFAVGTYHYSQKRQSKEC
ncbi:MAG: hypothetical protein ABIR19_03995 [Ginsengibacter sp.]